MTPGARKKQVILPPLSSLLEGDMVEGGIRCPKCGCRDTRVSYTWDVGGARRRKRVCRNCGREFPTTEK
jgi:DNA-directed RNA polymerase subunit RPC12/RpoP